MQRWYLTFGLLVGFLCACSAPQTKQVFSTTDPPDARQDHLLAVPFFPQSPYHCGPAALASAMNFRGVAVSPENLAKQVFLPARKGSLPLEMITATRRQGLIPYPVNKQIRTLFLEIDQGNPILVLQNLGFSWWPQWHYAIVIGYNWSDHELILHSGSEKNYRIGFSTFERTWARADYWGLVVISPGSLPADVNELTYLRTVYELEQTNKQLNPAPMYLAAKQHWRDSPLTLLSFANSSYQRGNSDKAITTLGQLLRLHPDYSPAWNNLAYIAREQGCYSLALGAAQKAATLAPESTSISHTLAEMESLHNPGEPAKCKAISESIF